LARRAHPEQFVAACGFESGYVRTVEVDFALGMLIVDAEKGESPVSARQFHHTWNQEFAGIVH
jgi:hypothetical protein